MRDDSKIYSVINPLVIKYPGIIRIGIFGSYARNEPINNDIDIVFQESPNNDVIDVLVSLYNKSSNIPMIN